MTYNLELTHNQRWASVDALRRLKEAVYSKQEKMAVEEVIQDLMDYLPLLDNRKTLAILDEDEIEYLWKAVTKYPKNKLHCEWVARKIEHERNR